MFPGTADAIEEQRYSEAEKVGFAFHKLGNFDPDFESWITNSERYIEASPVQKVKMLQKDKYRLESGYFSFMPDVDLITLELKARIETSNYFQQSQKGDTKTTVRIDLEDLPKDYIPVQVGNIWVAIIVKDFDLQKDITFDKEEYAEFVKKFGLAKTAYQTIDNIGIDMKLRPLSVDTTTPIDLDGIEMWLMLVETAELQLWRGGYNEKDYFYDYQAPWYVSEDHRELLRLYRQ